MLTRYVALLTAVSTEHSFVGLCSILLLHRKRTAPTANTVHLLALVCPVSMGPIVGFWVNCPFLFDISHLKSLVLIVGQFMIIKEELCIHFGFESKKNGQFS